MNVEKTLAKLQEIIDEFIKENGNIFDFIIKNEKIFISKYNQIKDIDILEIPDFVYGFDVKDKTIFDESATVNKIILGKNTIKLDYMFKNSTMKKIDLSELDLTGVISLKGMFTSCEIKEIGNISKWDVSSVTNMEDLFFLSEFKTVGDLSNWNVSSVSDMNNMFCSSNLEDIGDLSHWNVSSVSDMSYMFADAKMKTIGEIANWKLAKNPDLHYMFKNCAIRNIGNIDNWHLEEIKNKEYIFEDSLININRDLNGILVPLSPDDVVFYGLRVLDHYKDQSSPVYDLEFTDLYDALFSAETYDFDDSDDYTVIVEKFVRYQDGETECIDDKIAKFNHWADSDF